MRSLRPATLLTLIVVLAALVAPGATAHEERESFFPDQGAAVPEHRTFEEAAHVEVVCKPDSASKIDAIADPDLRAFNRKLLEECGFEHLQAAVDHVEEHGPAGGGTNIYVLPGLYLEEPSRTAECNASYAGGVVEYQDGYECPTITQLVGIFGDDPADEDRVCDNALCNLQIEGTGESPEDVLFRGGFKEDGDWIDRHNGIRADRADGIYIKDLAVELVRENGIYVHETDGYVIDGTLTRAIELYGVLTFAADHGLIKDCEAYWNGDSGIYPGSAADVNADNDQTAPLERWAVEVTGCNSHHNALGFSGTAGNSVNFHDNDWHHNGAGYVTDSFVGGHPGMPQDHAWLYDNRIYSNNENYYEEFVYSGICDKPPAERGHENGTVCPVFPVPVGTGVLIAGGNHNLVENNLIYDNWRTGVMLFWVPAIIRASPDDPGSLEGNEDQNETSHHNHFVNNTMGEHPDGLRQPNGTDFWWDDQGTGNCWQGNTSTATEDGTATSNSPHMDASFTTLPDCDSGGSVFFPTNPVKSASIASCALYDREDEPQPPGCDWFDSPSEPEGREEAAGDSEGTQPAPAPEQDEAAPAGGQASGGGPTTPVTGGGLLLGLLGAGAVAGATLLRRHRAVAVPMANG